MTSGDPYAYPGTDVLRNRFDIRDPDELRRREIRVSGARLAVLAHQPIPGRYDLAHLQHIHRYIFGDLYVWAGELGTVTIAKGELFALPAHIAPYLIDALAGLTGENYLRGASQEQTVERLAHYLGEINAVHPFREGNGRAQRAFIAQLAGEAGYIINWQYLDPERNINACIASMRGDNTQLQTILAELLQPARAVRGVDTSTPPPRKLG